MNVHPTTKTRPGYAQDWRVTAKYTPTSNRMNPMIASQRDLRSMRQDCRGENRVARCDWQETPERNATEVTAPNGS